MTDLLYKLNSTIIHVLGPLNLPHLLLNPLQYLLNHDLFLPALKLPITLLYTLHHKILQVCRNRYHLWLRLWLSRQLQPILKLRTA